MPFTSSFDLCFTFSSCMVFLMPCPISSSSIAPFFHFFFTSLYILSYHIHLSPLPFILVTTDLHLISLALVLFCPYFSVFYDEVLMKATHRLEHTMPGLLLPGPIDFLRYIGLYQPIPFTHLTSDSGGVMLFRTRHPHAEACAFRCT